MQSFTQIYKIHAPIKKVWQALVDPKIIDEWGGGSAKMSERKGKFSLWGGDIWGENTEVIKEKKLVQDWYSGEWKEPSYVRFDLSEKNGITTVVLTHKNVPDEEADDIESGWKEYYMGPLQQLLES